jgi:hypothetical protein
MKKLALAISLGAYIVLSASASSLAAYRADNASGVAANRDSRIAWSVTGTNARLLFLNEALYPETTGTAVTNAQLEHRKGERASTTDASAALTDSQLAHRKGERADAAQTDTTSTDTQRMFCEGDICLVP